MKKLIYRKDYIKKLLDYKDQDLIKVITGLRRSGKSTLLLMFKDELLSKGVSPGQIQYYNFELPENYLNKTWDKLYQEIKSCLLPGKINYIFLDEIQNIKDFERLVDGLYATEGTDIYITGSNATLLSGEIATLLSGRYIEISILPLSFAEYLQGREINITDKYLNYEALFFDYVNESSLPNVIELRELGYDKIYEYLEAIFKTIVEKDITQRHKIYEKRAFENVIRFLARSIGSQVSPSSIAKALRADNQTVHHLTVEKFIDYLVESFVFYRVYRFDIKGKKQLATKEKYYIVDPGFINILVGKDKSADRGHILENVVYLELIRRGYKVWTGSLRGGEVDFTVKTPTGEIEYYQVAWKLPTQETIEREFSALERIRDHYPKFVLSTETFVPDIKGIKHLNVFHWLLNL